MYFVDNNSAVPVMPQVKPVSSTTPLFFSEGGNGVPPTWPGPDWFNIFQTELLNILKEAGINPDKANHAQLLAAMNKLFLSRSNPFADIKTDGPPAIATALANLGLKAAAQRDVGTGANQIPDMSSFTGAWTGGGANPIVTGAGWQKGPDGVIEQWGVFGFGQNSTGTNVVFPTPFPSKVESIVLTLADLQESQLSPTTMPAIGVNSIGTSRTGFTARMSGAGGFNLFYIAKGR